MNDILGEALGREFTYFWYYFSIQFDQIYGYYIFGVVLGSLISVFGKNKIYQLFSVIQQKNFGAFGIIPATIIGIASPLCMYGTIPIAASLSEKGLKDDWLAAFMMSSILLNPQLIFYSAALGATALTIRIAACFVCGLLAGICIRLIYVNRGRSFFRFSGFRESAGRPIASHAASCDASQAANRDTSHAAGCDADRPAISHDTVRPATSCDADRPAVSHDTVRPAASRDTDPNIMLRLIKNILRNIKITGPYFIVGIILSAAFQRFVPESLMVALFGNDKALGALMAATIGVPLYVCGGGTIPLLQGWLASGMSMGAAAAFMVSGPATKITNLGALKIVLGLKNFIIYISFTVAFSSISGVIINAIIK